jgi:hypothetical protein
VSNHLDPPKAKYRVASPWLYSSLQLPGRPGKAFQVIPPAKVVEEAAPPAPQQPLKRAVWIVHGMGQQLPFETLDGLAAGIMRVAQPLPGCDYFEPRARTVQIGDQTVQRVELGVFAGDRQVELHLYEAYWAPVTEGKVKLADVISFLLDGSFRGLLNVFKSFKRAMFDEVVDVKIHKRAAAEISLALITLFSLILLNAVILAAGASKYGLTGHRFPHIADNWVALSSIASCLSAVAISFGVILFLAELSSPAATPRWIILLFFRIPTLLAAIVKWSKKIICLTVWAAFVLTLASITAGAVSLAFFAAYTNPSVSPADPLFSQLQALSGLIIAAAIALTLFVIALRGVFRSSGMNLWSVSAYFPYFFSSVGIFLLAFFGPLAIGFGLIDLARVYSHFPGWMSRPFWVWPFLLLLSYLVRELMIQYIGDVAAYISPNKLDRFNKIRKKIKKIALDSASAVYLARENGQFLYDKVAVVGHSLGSVIAYDTLNALLNAEKLSITNLDIARRTCLFETFGSPLDKIAFFFTVQGKNAFHIREQLAETVQPLISDYDDFRPFPWINVYSPNDIVSGKVELYDLPRDGQPAALQRLIRHHRVRHFSDSDAIVPLVAHVSYWKNREVWKRLYAEVTR